MFKHSNPSAGVLDGLLEHEGENLTSADALLKMVPPRNKALDAYMDRAVAAKKSLEEVVMWRRRCRAGEQRNKDLLCQ